MKKWLALAMTVIMAAASLVGCAQGSAKENSGSAMNSNSTELGKSPYCPVKMVPVPEARLLS